MEMHHESHHKSVRIITGKASGMVSGKSSKNRPIVNASAESFTKHLDSKNASADSFTKSLDSKCIHGSISSTVGFQKCII
jgi:hypothetical protein